MLDPLTERNGVAAEPPQHTHLSLSGAPDHAGSGARPRAIRKRGRGTDKSRQWRDLSVELDDVGADFQEVADSLRHSGDSSRS